MSEPVAEPEATKAPEAAPETTVEAAILSPDAQVVEANLANAQPVVADNIEPVATEAAPAATTEEAPATTEETPAEPAAPAAEKKEGSGLVAFIKKAIPNPKTLEKKAPKPETEAAPAPEIVEPAVEEGPFEGDAVTFKSHGGIFGTSWKARRLEFGKEGGLSNTAVLPYLALHKIAALVTPTDKANAAWDSAAHATVTGVGLLYVVKSKNLDVPINIINLAHVTEVTVSGNHFTIKTEHSGDYEFGTATPEKTQKWKAEIDGRTEQAKLALPAVVESEKYQENLASIKDLRGAHKAQETAVTSDEEAAVSGDETKRKGWGRRISGSFGKLTGTSKEAKEPAAEAPKDVAAVAPTESTADAAETPAVEAAVAAEAGETAATETPAEASADEPETSKKEKRKSFTGFAGLFKSKAKESSPEEPAKEPATEETPAAEPTATETPAVTDETPAATEEPAATPAPEVKGKSKRASIFNILPKKDKPLPTPVTNGETTAETTEEATPAEEVPGAETEDPEFKPAPTTQEGLVRRLTSQFKFRLSKSPEKAGKATKVSDEAPKIDYPIESTPAATSEPATDATPVVVEPLSTTEAPAVDLPTTTTTEPTPAVVTTQA